ncbi:hypothetical protein FSARC_8031 [Fusarium sarcochroum]|uniref:Uncharacterized protein n=1 Tax=Fusarium sarcochroum TaxID=1208366 RepID=A0A8H4TTW2_9HYPO|nr:hypothetical protein FSARC_8031 [Fusarium sarcochroum]
MEISKAVRAVGESAARVDVRAGYRADVTGRAGAKHFKYRSVLLKVFPEPITFAERRSILRVIEKHGQVEYFKPFPGQQSLFISLMKEEEAAQKLVDSSPVQSPIPASGSEPSPPRAIGMDRTTAQADEPMTNAREFTIMAEKAPHYKHQNVRSIVSRVWPDFIKTGKEFPSETLRQSLPSSIAAEGLRYWGLDFGKRATKDPRSIERIACRNWIPSRFKRPDEEFTQPEEEPTLAEEDRSPNQVAEEPGEELS